MLDFEEFMAHVWEFAREAWPNEYPEEIQIHMIGGRVKHLSMIYLPPKQKQAEPGEAGTEEKDAGGRSAGGKK